MTQIYCHSKRQQYALFNFWYVLLGLPEYVLYDEMEKALKLPRMGSRPWVLRMFITELQNSTHSRAIHFPNFSGLLILWGMSLQQQSILTCKYLIHECSVFSFKFPSDWSLGGLFLRQVSAFTKSIQFKQTATALVSVLFSWQAVQNNCKPDYLSAAKPGSNLN